MVTKLNGLDRLASKAHQEPEAETTDLTNPAFYINRELSWLEFNQRVLFQALDERHPLLERVKFISIAATNLDEFFMVRVATLLRKFRNNVEDVSPDGLNPKQQLDAIRLRANRMAEDLELYEAQLGMQGESLVTQYRLLAHP